MAEQPKPFNQRVYSGYIRPFLDDYVSPAMSAVGRYVPPELRSRLGSLVDVMPTPDTVTPTRNALAALGEGRYGTAAAETVNALAAPWMFTPMAAEMMMARGAQGITASARFRPDPISDDAWLTAMIRDRAPPSGNPLVSRTAFGASNPAGRPGVKTVSVDGVPVARATLDEARDGAIRILGINTLPAAQRQGYATRLVDDLQREFPGTYIDTTMRTGPGEALFAKFPEIKRASSRINGLPPRADLPSTAEYGNLQRSISAGFDPPKVPARPYEADYPRGGPGYDPSRPFTSPEGAVIDAPFVAGRRGYGAPDQGLLPGQSSELSRLLTGTVPEGVAARELPPRAVGSLRITPGPDRTTRQVLFEKSLSDPKRERVIAHEVGHLIDGASGLSLAPFPKRETAKVYSDLYTGQAHRTRQLTGPQHVGYKPSEVPGELIAEAVRAYMMDPAYLKTVAPKTARQIREYVNTHPTLSKIIQFNALAAAALPALDGDR